MPESVSDLHWMFRLFVAIGRLCELMDQVDARYRAIRCMKVHDRSKLLALDDVLARNLGQEESFISRMVSHYGPEPVDEPFADRLSRFFLAWAPERISEIDSIVKLNPDKSQQSKYMTQLVDRYGGEPEPPTPRGAQGADLTEIRAELTIFYRFYAPDKIDTGVDNAIRGFKDAGNWDEMWKILEAKYGPRSAISEASATVTPAAAAPDALRTLARLATYYAEYVPDRPFADVERVLQKISEGADVWPQLTLKYGPEPPSHFVDAAYEQAVKLRDFFAGNSSPEAEIYRLLMMHSRGQNGGFDGMWASLNSGPPVSERNRQRRRLVAFYSHYNVERSEAEIDDAVARFNDGARGGYAAMWEKLVGRYGPEPEYEDVDDEVTEADAPEDDAAVLRRFYDAFVPERTDAEVATFVERFRGPDAPPGGITVMWDKLHEKYGATPPRPTWHGCHLRRLRAFFRHYGLAKSQAEIDWILAKTPNEEAMTPLWENLKRQHGPEPPDPRLRAALRGPTFITSRRGHLAASPERPVARAGAPTDIALPVRQATNAPNARRFCIRFVGLDEGVLLDFVASKRAKLTSALEQQVAMNAGLPLRAVALVKFSGCTAEFEVTCAAGTEEQTAAALTESCNRASRGCFSVTALRTLMRAEFGISPVQLFAAAAFIGEVPGPVDIDRSTQASADAPPLPELPPPEARSAALVENELQRMSPQKRFTAAWRRGLEDRLNGIGGPSRVTREQEAAFKDFMREIWADASAFSSNSS